MCGCTFPALTHFNQSVLGVRFAQFNPCTYVGVCLTSCVRERGRLVLVPGNIRDQRDVTFMLSSFIQTPPCPCRSDGHMCSQLTLASFPVT